MGKLNSRAAKRRNAARRASSGGPSRIPDKAACVPVIDSDNSDGSSLDSAAADYAQEVYGFPNADDYERENGAVPDGRELCLLEELFPSLGNVDPQDAMMDSGSTDEERTWQDSQVPEFPSVRRWYDVERCLSVDMMSSQKDGAREVIAKLYSFVAATAGIDTGETMSIRLTSGRLCIAVFELAVALGLNAVLDVDSKSSDEENARVVCTRKVTVGESAGVSASIRNSVDNVLDRAFANRAPSHDRTLLNDEAKTRNHVEQFVTFLLSPEAPAAVSFLNCSSVSTAVLVMIAEIFGCTVHTRPLADLSEVSCRRGGATVVPRALVVGICEAVVRQFHWDDLNGLKLGRGVLKRAYPPVIGSVESLVRSVSTHVLSIWQSQSDVDTSRELDLTLPLPGRTVLLEALHGSFGISCTESESAGASNLIVRLPPGEPCERSVRVLSAHVNSEIEACRNSLDSDGNDERAMFSKASELGTGDEIVMRELAADFDEKVGDERIVEQYYTALSGLIDFLTTNPSSEEMFVLLSSPKKIRNCLKQVAKGCGYPLSMKQKERGLPRTVVGGRDGHFAPSRDHMMAFGLQLFTASYPKLNAVVSMKSSRRHRVEASKMSQPRYLEAAPLDAKNRGFQMLSKMGHDPSKGLGVDNCGIVEPIKVKLPVKRHGIGL